MIKLFKRLLPNFDPVLLRLFQYVLPYKLQLAIAALFMGGVASTTTLTSMLLGKLIDKGFYEQNSAMIIFAPLALIVVTLMFAICTVVSSYILTKVSQSILVKIRTQLFYNVLRWPTGVYQQYSTGLVCSKFVNESHIALNNAVQAGMVLVRDSMQVLALFGLLLWQNWQLTLVACVVGPLAGALLGRIRKHTRRIVKESQEAIADTLSKVQESYEAQRLVKVSDSYGFEERRFAKINESIRGTGLMRLKLASMGTPVTQIVTMMGVAIVVAVALLQARQGNLSMGEFITFLSAMLFLMQPLQNLAGLNATFTAVSVAGRSIFDMMDAPVQEDKGKHILRNIKGEIVFKDVYVRYPGTDDDALKGFTLKIDSGKHVALVGHSGSGKTTTVNLLPRFLDATTGVVSVDGIDVQDCTLESLREHIAIVSQDVILFDATIRENITYGVKNVTDSDILAACDAAALTEFIQLLPQGLETRVGEAGNLLSGGQKQRISIARAFLKNAPILILDEATSALDSESERIVKKAITKLMRDRTTITVAHRLSTIVDADWIVVMKNGKIEEQGTHTELISNHGSYEQFCSLQMLT